MEKERRGPEEGAWRLFLATGLPEAWLLSRRQEQKGQGPSQEQRRD